MFPLKSDEINATVLPDGRWLLYDRIEHAALTLTAPAGILWELCDGETSIDLLVSQMQELYPETPESDLEAETRQVLRSFLEQGLIANNVTPTT